MLRPSSAPARPAISAGILAASMFYERRLDELGKEFAARNLAPVVVKGQAIVDLAFPEDEIRLSGDIDLLAGEDDGLIAAALKELGYEELPPHSQHYAHGERTFFQRGTRLPAHIEVHRGLDKILVRPIPYPEILARAKPSGRTGFRYPTVEDLFLLVVLHASADIYFDPERVERDLRFLIDNGKPDMDVVRMRARQWELSRALRRLSSERYRRDWSRSKGAAAYFAAQVGWHDRPSTVLGGLAKYSYARLLDRLFP